MYHGALLKSSISGENEAPRTHCKDQDAPPKLIGEADSNTEGAKGISGRYWSLLACDHHVLHSAHFLTKRNIIAHLNYAKR